jgi:AraC-like DNA-binding protein
MKSLRPSQLETAREIVRHRHAAAYATLVVEGAYEEAGEAGRFKVSPGDVLLHAPFSIHRDIVSNRRTIVLDLPLPFDGRDWTARGRIADPDAILALAKYDASEARSAMLGALVPSNDAEADLPDLLARDLSEDASRGVGEWAEERGVARETAWRHFRGAYGVDIAAYRSEARARKAWRMIMASDAPLASIAAAAGFSDQPHMSRAVKALTGATPGAWRRKPATSVQDAGARAG